MSTRRKRRLYVDVVLLLFLHLVIGGRLLYRQFELFVGFGRLVLGLERGVGMGERKGRGRGPLNVSAEEADSPARSGGRLNRLNGR